MAGTPSFFLLGSDDDRVESDEAGAWTEVRHKKLQKRKARKNESVPGGRGVAGRRGSRGPHPDTPSSAEMRAISWRVPHGDEQAWARSAWDEEAEDGASERDGEQLEVELEQVEQFLRSSSAQQPSLSDSVLQSKVDANEREKLRLKIWNILFRNVNRTVDELYYMCEFDSSEASCVKAEELLATHLEEFTNLKNRIRAQDEFAKSGSPAVAEAHVADSSARETARGVAWEVRKANASPSPITLLFGSRLREASGDGMTILKRRSLKQLSFSSSKVNQDWADADAEVHGDSEGGDGGEGEGEGDSRATKLPSTSEGRSLPVSSAWVKKPKIVREAEAPSLPSTGFSTIPQQQQKQQQQQQQQRQQRQQRLERLQQRKQRNPKSGPQLERKEQQTKQQTLKQNRRQAVGQNQPTPATEASSRPGGPRSMQSEGGKPPPAPAGRRLGEKARAKARHSWPGYGPSSETAEQGDALVSPVPLPDPLQVSEDEAATDTAEQPETTTSALEADTEAAAETGRSLAHQQPSPASASSGASLFGGDDDDDGDNGHGHSHGHSHDEVARSESGDSPPLNVFDFGGSSALRWGDEAVGLTEGMAVMSPRAKRACAACSRHVLPRDSECKLCSSCMANAAARQGSGTREVVMRSLHEKLSSPERRKPSPSETKRRQVEKQANARLNREMIDLQRQAKLRAQSSRQEQVAKTKEEGILKQERAISERLERAAVAREAKLKSVAKMAKNESLKVNEVQFINEMTEQEKTAQLHKKLEDGEKRRREFIGTIREKAEKQSERAEARRLREEGRERQLREAMQKRHEEAEKRKAEALEEQRRKLDEMVLEASAKVNERRTEMEKEREARLMLIKEREERAEQERMKHLLAKRAMGRQCTASPSAWGPPGSPSSLQLATDAAAASRDCSPAGTPRSDAPRGFGDDPGSPQVDRVTQAQAEEEEAAAKRLQLRERQMKKRARKIRLRLQALCDAADVESLVAGLELGGLRGSGKVAQRMGSAVRALEADPGKSTPVEVLLRLLRAGESADPLAARCLPLLGSLFASALAADGDESRAGDALELLAHAAEASPEFAARVVLSGKAAGVVDCCTRLLRHPSGRKEGLTALVNGSRALRALLAQCTRLHGKAHELDVAAGELVRLCLFSSLVLRLSERCTEVKCGRRWMGCTGRCAACPNVGAALDLVRNSLGLTEVIAAFALREGGQTAEVVSAAAAESFLFRVVSQLVAVFIAVEDSKPQRGKATSDLEAMLCVAAHSGLRALNLLACVDLDLVQGVLGSPALPFELQQLLRYALGACCAGHDIPGPPARDWGALSQELVGSDTSREELFAELVVLMGFYAQAHEHNQESLNWGQWPTPLSRLCHSPLRYFVSPVGKSILFPTLLAIICGNSVARSVVAQEVSPKLLANFLAARPRDETPNQRCRFPERLWPLAAHACDS